MEDDCLVPVCKKIRTKPKVVKEWEDEDVFKLISLVEDRQCLWNAGDDGYHNKILRESAWQEIGEHFGSKYATTDLNAKWTNLRIQFRGYAGRAKTKSGQGAVEAPKWKYFAALGFVGRAEDQQTQPTTSNIVFEIESDSNSLDNSTLTPPLSTQRQAAITPRRPQVGNGPSAATQIAETMREAVAAMKEKNKNSTDPNTSFSNYLLSELKTLSDEAAATVRKRVTSRVKTIFILLFMILYNYMFVGIVT